MLPKRTVRASECGSARPADGSGQHPPLQHLVRPQADRIPDAFGLQQSVYLGLGERRVGAKIQIDAAFAVAGDHRLQE
jgi:hypothetical protein